MPSKQCPIIPVNRPKDFPHMEKVLNQNEKQSLVCNQKTHFFPICRSQNIFQSKNRSLWRAFKQLSHDTLDSPGWAYWEVKAQTPISLWTTFCKVSTSAQHHFPCNCPTDWQMKCLPQKWCSPFPSLKVQTFLSERVFWSKKFSRSSQHLHLPLPRPQLSSQTVWTFSGRECSPQHSPPPLLMLWQQCWAWRKIPSSSMEVICQTFFQEDIQTRRGSVSRASWILLHKCPGHFKYYSKDSICPWLRKRKYMCQSKGIWESKYCAHTSKHFVLYSKSKIILNI